MENAEAIVYIVDDDEELCASLSWLLDSVNIPSHSFNDVASFLTAYDPARPACLVLDVRMPRTGGFQLQETLNQSGSPVPIIFVSAHGDVRMSVKALQQGAVNFLEKPYDPQQMLDVVQETLELAVTRFEEDAERRSVNERLASLTPREREILALVAGRDAQPEHCPQARHEREDHRCPPGPDQVQDEFGEHFDTWSATSCGTAST